MKKILTVLGVCVSLLLISSFNVSSDVDILNKLEGNKDLYKDFDNELISMSEWLPSDDSEPNYGKGRFFYRLYRSTYTVDSRENYKFEIHFISDSYYPRYMYESEPYRCATKVDMMRLYVNNSPYINTIYNSPSFWLVFEGSYERAVGDVGVVFYHKSPNPVVYISWDGVKPF